MLCAHTSRSISSSSPLSNPHLCTDEDPEGRFFWTRICLTPLEGLQLSLDSPGPQGGGPATGSPTYISLFSVWPLMQALDHKVSFLKLVPRLPSLLFIYVFIHSFIEQIFIKKQLCARYCSWYSEQNRLKFLIL